MGDTEEMLDYYVIDSSAYNRLVHGLPVYCVYGGFCTFVCVAYLHKAQIRIASVLILSYEPLRQSLVELRSQCTGVVAVECFIKQVSNQSDA
jgi:hypothetical protein